jgi:penicillin-binding protein-related factor A (putative recombinase)
VAESFGSGSDLGRESQFLGMVGETVARALLVKHGFVEIERVWTPWHVVWKNGIKGRVPAKAFPQEKVCGDFIAMEKGTGRKVLAEAKATDGDRIIYSVLKDHQIRSLDQTVSNGGLSFLICIIQGEGFLLPWPISGFTKGHSLVRKGKEIFVS